MFFRKFPRFSGYSSPSSSTIRSALWENAHPSLAAVGVLLATAGGALLLISFLSCSPRWSQEGQHQKTVTIASASQSNTVEMPHVDVLKGGFFHSSSCHACLGQASVSLGAPRMPTNLLHHGSQNRIQKTSRNWRPERDLDCTRNKVGRRERKSMY